jgi:AsmA protein
MKKVLAIVGGVIVLVIAAAVIIPFLIPTETYKAQVKKQVEAATNRDFSIAGDVGLSLLPSTELTVNKVAFGNAEWAGPEPMARLGSLRVKVDPWALISGNLKIQSFVLQEPIIQLAVNKDGTPNWQFGTGGGADKTTTDGGGTGAGAPLQDISLEDVRLVNGRVTYDDKATGATYQLTNVNLSLALESLDAPFSGDGTMTYNGEPIDIDLETGPPRRLINAEQTDVTANVESKHIKLKYDGTLTNAQPQKLDGQVDLTIPSVKKLAAWVGEPIAASEGTLETFAIKGDVRATGPRYAFTANSIQFDKIDGKGALTIDLGGAKPNLTGELQVGRLDVTPYMPPPTEEGEAAAEGADGGTAPTEWSDEEIDVAALKAANVDFDLQVESIKARDIEVGQSALAVRLKDGKLTADLTKLALYDGSGTGTLLVDSRASAPKMGMAFDLTGVSAKPLLTDAAGFERLEGAGDIEFDVAAQGDSQKALIADLDGNGAISFTDGAIVGINIAKMVRNVGNAFTGAGGTQKTDFAELAGTFTITDGVLKNDDLVMLNPLLRVRGEGMADLNQRTVDYRLTPKAVASLEGQGGDVDRSGVAVPVIVKGPWHDISYRPDLEAVLKDAIKDPEAMKKDAKKAIKSLKEGGDIGSALEGLTGGGSGDGASSGDGQTDGGASDGGSAKDKLQDAKDKIKGLFD